MCRTHTKENGDCTQRVQEEKHGEKLADNKNIGGKNRLTDTLIDKIQNYYGQAIKKSCWQ